MALSEYEKNWIEGILEIQRRGKPCLELHYCPYGSLVEQFDIGPEETEITCKIYGHNCPVYTVGEPLKDE